MATYERLLKLVEEELSNNSIPNLIRETQRHGDHETLKKIKDLLKKRESEIFQWSRKIDEVLGSLGFFEEGLKYLTLSQWKLLKASSEDDKVTLVGNAYKALERRGLAYNGKVSPLGRDFLIWVTPQWVSYEEEVFIFTWRGWEFQLRRHASETRFLLKRDKFRSLFFIGLSEKEVQREGSGEYGGGEEFFPQNEVIASIFRLTIKDWMSSHLPMPGTPEFSFWINRED